MERPFDHEKLDVYQIELQFVGWLADFFVEISKSRAARCRELFDQLDRASRIQPGKEMLGRAVAMLIRLVDRFDTEESLHRSSI